MADDATRRLTRRLVDLLGTAAAKRFLEVAAATHDEVELRLKIESLLVEYPNLTIAHTREIVDIIPDLKALRPWIVREGSLPLDLRLNRERRISAASMKKVERILELPKDRPILNAFRYAFQLKRILAKARDSPQYSAQELNAQDRSVIQGIERGLERNPPGLNIKNLVLSGKFNGVILPELERIWEFGVKNRKPVAAILSEQRVHLLGRITFDENQVFVSYRSTDDELIQQIYDRLVVNCVAEVSVLGGGSTYWRRAMAISQRFIDENPEFETTKTITPGLWVIGECKIRRKPVTPGDAGRPRP